jgi:NAD kinase
MQKSNSIENVIIIRNKTRLEQLTERFNTQEQAKFYITQQKKAYSFQKAANRSKKAEPVVDQKSDEEFKMYDEEHMQFYESFNSLQKNLGNVIKFKVIEQEFLPNYLFTDKDLVIVIGQDGLVANTAKYVHNIPIIAVNPDPSRYDGVLLPFNHQSAILATENVLTNNYNYDQVSMGEALLNDGQRLLAFNDFFIGPSSHISARYQITLGDYSENQSSSGIVVSTGAGSTGWLSSLFNMANSIHRTFADIEAIPYQALPRDSEQLIFVVREPFLSKTSQINLTSGIINPDSELIIESHMPQNGIIFSDGIYSDFIKFNAGAIVTIKLAVVKAKLVKN